MLMNDFKSLANNGILVPNQKKYTVNKLPTNAEKDANGEYKYTYTTNNLKALANAAANISNNSATFKLYIYLAQNRDKQEFNLSSKHFCEWAHCSYKAYKKAFAELELLGYIRKRETINNNNSIYDFYDYVLIDECITIVNQEVV